VNVRSSPTCLTPNCAVTRPTAITDRISLRFPGRFYIAFDSLRTRGALLQCCAKSKEESTEATALTHQK